MDKYEAAFFLGQCVELSTTLKWQIYFTAHEWKLATASQQNCYMS